MEIDLSKTEGIDLLDKMSPEDIENIRGEKMKENSIAQNYTSIVEQKFLNIQLQMITLQKEKKELEITLSKGKQNIRDLSTQIKILTSKFWSVKNG